MIVKNAPSTGPTVLHNIDLNIAQGEVVVIIGPSVPVIDPAAPSTNWKKSPGDLIVDGLKVNDRKLTSA